MSTINTSPQFKTKNGQLFSGFHSLAIKQMHSVLAEQYGISSEQVVEAASYSMAMVVRYALGLSATGGKVCAVVKDCLAGYVALATLRHLVNAGCDAQALLVVEDPTALSTHLKTQTHPLQQMGVKLPDIGSALEVDQFTEFLGSAHNVLFGVFDSKFAPDPFITGISDLLNEERTPVHCIEAPSGVDPDTGMPLETPLYASSTLSLGAPLTGLLKGKDYVGRHYLCDVSFTKKIYTNFGNDLTFAFADQPVAQIFPLESDSL